MDEDNQEHKAPEHKRPEHRRPEHKMYMEHHQHKQQSGYKTAAWVFGAIALVLAIALIALLIIGGAKILGGLGGTNSAGSLSATEIETKTLAYLKEALPGQEVSIDGIKDEGDMYSIKLTVAGRTYDSYVSKDGSLLFPSYMNMNEKIDAGETAQPPADTNIPKTDKPVVELFVMSHCPYGTQAEKGMLPAARALGDTIDFKIKFVYYAMHGEKEVKEQLTQYCIQSEQPSKYLAYLACFLNDSAGQGSEAASDKCIASLGIDTKKLDTCTDATDEEFDIMKNLNDEASWLSGRFPLFNTDKEANDKYGIGGSPTLVINGVQSNAGRDSASYLAAICNAMTTPAAECQTQLSAVSPGPGFGYDSTAAATAAGCGV